MAERPAQPLRSAGSRAGELALLAALAAWSLASLLLVRIAGPDDGVFTGADGIVAIDQLQYLAWIRAASESPVVSNSFVIGDSRDVFLHPVFALSGLAVAAGASVQVALLVWKPVAVVALFAGFRAYVARFFEEARWASLAALALALFSYYPIQSLLERASLGTADERFRAGILTLELFPAGLLWGYLPSAIAIGLMPLFLLALERALDPARRSPGRGAAWYAGWAAAAGLVACWLHPWRGLVLVGIVGVVAVWERAPRRYLLAVPPLAATVAPLAYYGVLSRVDADWEHATVQNAILKPPLWGLLLALVPLAAIAAFGVRGLERDFQSRALVAWPLVSFVAYFVSPSFPSHAFAGASLPLAILAVRAARRLRPPPLVAVAATGLAIVPGAISVSNLLDDAVTARATPHFLTTSEEDALDALDRHPAAGGVLPTPYLGMAVPGYTGRDSWLGNYLWTPDYYDRQRAAEALFDGRLTPAGAQALVRASGARFVLSDCDSSADLGRLLGPEAVAVSRFGCATVVELREAPG